MPASIQAEIGNVSSIPHIAGDPRRSIHSSFCWAFLPWAAAASQQTVWDSEETRAACRCYAMNSTAPGCAFPGASSPCPAKPPHASAKSARPITASTRCGRYGSRLGLPPDNRIISRPNLLRTRGRASRRLSDRQWRSERRTRQASIATACSGRGASKV